MYDIRYLFVAKDAYVAGWWDGWDNGLRKMNEDLLIVGGGALRSVIRCYTCSFYADKG